MSNSSKEFSGALKYFAPLTIADLQEYYEHALREETIPSYTSFPAYVIERHAESVFCKIHDC